MGIHSLHLQRTKGETMRAVILQPMYLPWMGYFGLIDIADVFVFYDDVQFVKRSWHQRNKIKMPNGNWIWLTVPVIQNPDKKININEVMINNSIKWAEKHWKSIKHAYTKAPFFKDYAPIFEEIYKKEWTYLSNLNIALIEKISDLLGLKNDKKFIYSSELKVEGKKTDRLINILTKIGADEYISGPTAKAYIDSNKFKEAGITLYWYEFNHPTYPQLYGDFIPYMSVIDLLFNVGENALNYIRKGSKNALILEGGT